jgi:hypothetical protein
MKRIKSIFQLTGLSILLLFSSCATLLNQPVQKIFISTDKNIKSVVVRQSMLTDSSLTSAAADKGYYVRRSSQPLVVELQLDSTRKTIVLKAKNSFAFWFNIYCNYGIGMLIDKDNNLRYGYSKRNYFAVVDSTIKKFSFTPSRKGTINLSLTWPFANIFNFKSPTAQYKSSGVLGIGAGLEYFYNNNHYASLNFGAGTDVFGEYFGDSLVSGTAIYTSVRNNYIVGKFDFGYGINLTKFQWERSIFKDTISLYQLFENTAVGLSLSANYRLGNYFRLGLLYQPCFLSTNFSPALNYQHFISFNLIWKFPIWYSKREHSEQMKISQR